MHVVVGITGGISAYKASSIIRLLTEAGHSVKVIPTQNALRFIGAATLEALSHNSVDPDLYADVDSVKHVSLGQEADLVIIAPATASFIARYSAGIADDLLSNTLLVTKAPIVVAPAMHSEMWLHEATVNNIKVLRDRGVHVLEPETGRLTGSDSGIGRLPEPEKIVEFAMSKVGQRDLLGKRFLVTAGGTREPIDPVRFIGNRSSGKQGIEIALAAKRRGAFVTLIAANISTTPSGLDEIVNVQTTLQYQEQVISRLSGVDCAVMAAAVSDYRPIESATQKLKRSEIGNSLTLQLVANPDVLAEATLRIQEKNLKTITVGFAAETLDPSKNLQFLASKKLSDKGCDVLVANDVSGGKVFDAEENDVLIVTRSGRVVSSSGSKALVASEITNVIADLLSK